MFFLQESYSTPEVEKIWKSQWKGEMFFSHGTEHSRGILILIKNSLEFELKTTKVDKNSRFIILEANVQDHPFLFVDLYVPNKTNEQSTFFDEIREELDNFCLAEDCNIVIGGDFNIIFDPDRNEKNQLSALRTSALLMIYLIHGGLETQM